MYKIWFVKWRDHILGDFNKNHILKSLLLLLLVFKSYVLKSNLVVEIMYRGRVYELWWVTVHLDMKLLWTSRSFADSININKKGLFKRWTLKGGMMGKRQPFTSPKQVSITFSHVAKSTKKSNWWKITTSKVKEANDWCIGSKRHLNYLQSLN